MTWQEGMKAKRAFCNFRKEQPLAEDLEHSLLQFRNETKKGCGSTLCVTSGSVRMVP